MPAHAEAWVPNAEGRGIVIADFVCRTLAELNATRPVSGAAITAAPRPLWRPNAAGRLEALLEVLVFHPATTAGGAVLPAGRHPLAIVCYGQQRRSLDDSSARRCSSHHGYSGFSANPPAVATGNYLQEALAERGIISVSVSTNAANKLNPPCSRHAFPDSSSRRSSAPCNSLDPRDSSDRYHRRIDFQRVALIGHSRGRDAVVRAAEARPRATRACAHWCKSRRPTAPESCRGLRPPPRP